MGKVPGVWQGVDVGPCVYESAVGRRDAESEREKGAGRKTGGSETENCG